MLSFIHKGVKLSIALSMSLPFKKLGLEESEALVYQSLLEHGAGSVTEITKAAGIDRSLGYHVLQKLALKNLVERVSGRGKKMQYAANHPRSLIQHLSNKRNQLGRQVKEAERLLPELVSMFKVADRPIVRYQMGTRGAKSIYLETLESTTEIFSILDLQDWFLPDFYLFGKEYTRERSRRKIHERMLLIDTPYGQKWMKDYWGSFKYTDYRWIKAEQIPGIKDFGGEMNIYENKVMMAITRKPHRIGIMVDSKPLANILKGLFELAWQVAIPPKKKGEKSR